MKIIGPYAVKLPDQSEYPWVKFSLDETDHLMGYQIATNMAQDQWSDLQDSTDLPKKMTVYDPTISSENAISCVVIGDDSGQKYLSRFQFRHVSGSALPLPTGQRYKTISIDNYTQESGWIFDTHEKSRGRVSSEDYQKLEESVLRNLNDAYAARDLYANLKWHQGKACSELNLTQDEAGSDKVAITTPLSPFQQFLIRQVLQYDWNALKTESKNSAEYCQALSLIMTGSLSSQIMDELEFSGTTNANAPNLRYWLLPSNIDKMKSRFYDEANAPNVTIADVHDYMIQLMQQEISQYDLSLVVHVDANPPRVRLGQLGLNSTNVAIPAAPLPTHAELESQVRDRAVIAGMSGEQREILCPTTPSENVRLMSSPLFDSTLQILLNNQYVQWDLLAQFSPKVLYEIIHSSLLYAISQDRYTLQYLLDIYNEGRELGIDDDCITIIMKTNDHNILNNLPILAVQDFVMSATVGNEYFDPEMPLDIRETLLNGNCILAIKEGFCTARELAELGGSRLTAVSYALRAVRDGRVSFEVLKRCPLEAIYEALESHDFSQLSTYPPVQEIPITYDMEVPDLSSLWDFETRETQIKWKKVAKEHIAPLALAAGMSQENVDRLTNSVQTMLAIKNGDYSLEVLARFDQEVLEELISETGAYRRSMTRDHADKTIKDVIHAGICTLQNVFDACQEAQQAQMPPSEIIHHAGCILAILEHRISLQELMTMDPQMRQHVMSVFDKVDWHNNEALLQNGTLTPYDYVTHYDEVMQLTRNSDAAESLLSADCVLVVKNAQCTIPNLVFLQTKFGTEPAMQVIHAIKERKTSFEDVKNMSVDALTAAIEANEYPTEHMEQHTVGAARNINSMFCQSNASVRLPLGEDASADMADTARRRSPSPGAGSGGDD